MFETIIASILHGLFGLLKLILTLGGSIGFGPFGS